MNSDYFNRHYWTYYLMLEQKLLATQNYVDFDKDNYQTYSNEYALLLQAVGADDEIRVGHRFYGIMTLEQN